MAARSGNLTKVTALLESADPSIVNVAGDDGCTALHLACFKRRADVVKYVPFSLPYVCSFVLVRSIIVLFCINNLHPFWGWWCLCLSFWLQLSAVLASSSPPFSRSVIAFLITSDWNRCLIRRGANAFAKNDIEETPYSLAMAMQKDDASVIDAMTGWEDGQLVPSDLRFLQH